MPKRLPYEILMLAALALGSCSRPEWEQKLDAADINARNALSRQAEIIDRLDRIEQRLGMQ